MFHTNFLQDDQSYLVADYDHFSLTVGVLKFQKRIPHLEHCVKSFFPPEKREFHPRLFEQYFRQCCDQLRDHVGELPEEVCIFVDQGNRSSHRPDIPSPVQIRKNQSISKSSMCMRDSSCLSQRIRQRGFGMRISAMMSQIGNFSLFSFHIWLSTRGTIFFLLGKMPAT